jgi:hypothetical protein
MSEFWLVWAQVCIDFESAVWVQVWVTLSRLGNFKRSQPLVATV